MVRVRILFETFSNGPVKEVVPTAPLIPTTHGIYNLQCTTEQEHRTRSFSQQLAFSLQLKLYKNLFQRVNCMIECYVNSKA